MGDEVKKEEPKVEDKKPDVLEVDVFGVSIPLPIDTAKQIIAKRDERHSVFKDLSEKVKNYETKLQDTQRQAEAQKAALEGKLSEAESLFSKKAEEKLSNIQNRIITKEIESTLLSDETFLKDAKEDAMKLLKADMKFKLSDDGAEVLTEDGKKAQEAVKEWLKNKTIFKKATGVTPTGGKVGPKETSHKVAVKEKVSLTAALQEVLNKKK
jgi:hypothetical protein